MTAKARDKRLAGAAVKPAPAAPKQKPSKKNKKPAKAEHQYDPGAQTTDELIRRFNDSVQAVIEGRVTTVAPWERKRDG